MKATLLLGGGCLALLACTMDDPCAEPSGAACGGDPSGNWIVLDSCRDPAYANPEAVTYYGQTQNMARQPPPEPTSSDWCSDLRYEPQKGITLFTFPHDTLEIAPGRPVTYDLSGRYATLLRTAGVGSVDISASCLTRFAVVFQCASADASTPEGTRSVADDLAAYSGTFGTYYQNIVCNDDGNGGCFCSYTILSEPGGGGLSGRWSTQGGLMTHFPDTLPIPSQVDLCVTGDTMTLWGHDRTAVWDQAGLRTVTLQRCKPSDTSTACMPAASP